jgi:hypothetical protein
MSLRKSPELTPELVAAARENARRSTGPRTSAGKQRMKMNALQHGWYAAPENERAAMLALGENPQEFDVLHRELMLAYGPGDLACDKQIEELARLYWRRRRLERQQSGLMRRALQEGEERQHQREREMALATFEPSCLEMLDVTLPESRDPGVHARETLSYLELIRAQVQIPLDAQEESGGVSAPPNRAPVHSLPAPRPATRSPLPVRLGALLETLYQGGMGWRVARICGLLRALGDSNETGGTVLAPGTNALPNSTAAGSAEVGAVCLPPRFLSEEPQTNANNAYVCATLLTLLDEEIADVRNELNYAEQAHRERTAIERDACLAPVGETWGMLLRQEATLERLIDRKVRMILTLRKEYARLLEAVDTPHSEDGLEQEMRELDAILGVDFQTECPTDQNPPQNPISPEQTGNVAENKAPVRGKR